MEISQGLDEGDEERIRRRPSGEAPPLPRELGRTGRLLLVLVGVGAALILFAVLAESYQLAWSRLDSAFLRGVAEFRSDAVTEVMQFIDGAASRWPLRVLRWGTMLVLIAFRRWRHLLVFVGAIITLEFVAYSLSLVAQRPKPFGVEILTDWEGFSMPSRPLGSLAVTLFAMAYALVPAGRSRYLAKCGAAALLGLLWIARTYLGADNLGDLLFGTLLGITIPIVFFRWFAPNDVFPVTYGRGKTAHLDVGGRRGEAIRAAVQGQLGMAITALKPVGLAGSGGSTPLRLTLAPTASEPKRYTFAKLYARNHVRADRWYKLGRTILYGALEDETPFQTVRRFVEYEDYALRLMQDFGLPTPEPYGIVEITPEREYIIVMEFFAGAVEIGEAEVDDDVIDQGLNLIRRHVGCRAGAPRHQARQPHGAGRTAPADRRLLRAGPAVSVAAGGRPGEHDAGARACARTRERVYDARPALVHRRRDRRGLRGHPRRREPHPAPLDDEGGRPRPVGRVPRARPPPGPDPDPALEPPTTRADRVGAARGSDPARASSCQNWAVLRVRRRLAAAAIVLGLSASACSVNADSLPGCDAGSDRLFVLAAQAVPSATLLPCVAELPSGWTFGGSDTRSGVFEFWLELGPSRSACGPGHAPGLVQPRGRRRGHASDRRGRHAAFRAAHAPSPGFSANRYYTFAGGCVVYAYRFAPEAPATLALEADQALTFRPRQPLVDELEKHGLVLCGAGAPPCPGGD